MKKKHLIIYIMLLALVAGAASCSSDGEYLYSHKRVAVRIHGYNGSDNYLTVKLDTADLDKSPISTNSNFDQMGAIDVSSFPAGSSLKLTVKKKESGEVIFQKDISVETPVEEIKLFYLQGKVYNEVPKADPKEGYTLTSYFLNTDYQKYGEEFGTKYRDKIDVVFYKVVQHTSPELSWQWQVDSETEIGRLSGLVPNTFSPFVAVPEVDQTPIQTKDDNGLVIRTDQTKMKVKAYKAGTTIPYYEDAGYIADGEIGNFPYNYSPEPTVLLLNEQTMIYDGVKYYNDFGRYDIIRLR